MSVVIPARLESTRLPGKLLLELGGWPVLRHVWERARRSECAQEVVIATDAEEIRAAAQSWGAEVRMTSKDCPNGTARVASLLPGLAGDFIVNVQGDEPFIEPTLIDALAEAWGQGGADIITAVRLVETLDELEDPHLVKVQRGLGGRAVAFSRAAVPHLRGVPREQWLARGAHWAHIGIYGFSRPALARYPELTPGVLEEAEKLEQLRFLEHGMAIVAVETDYRPLGIDTPADLARARARMDG